jgi:hypothetical protein
MNTASEMDEPIKIFVSFTEVTRRRTEARRLRVSAGAECAAPTARFKQELLGATH